MTEDLDCVQERGARGVDLSEVAVGFGHLEQRLDCVPGDRARQERPEALADGQSRERFLDVARPDLDPSLGCRDQGEVDVPLVVLDVLGRPGKREQRAGSIDIPAFEREEGQLCLGVHHREAIARRGCDLDHCGELPLPLARHRP